MPAATAALDRLRAGLAGRNGLSDVVAVGEEAFVWFLRNVAVIAESPDELAPHAASGVGARRRVGGRRQAPGQHPAGATVAGVGCGPGRRRSGRRGGDPPLLRRWRVPRAAESLRRYLNAELPDYLAPLRFLGVLDDLTDEFRLDEDGVSSVPPPSPDLPYFYAANAHDPRAGISHEGAHYQQLSLSNAHPNPIRRRYYDSGANEGIAFYNEEYLLQAGLFDDAPHTRTVIWNFARLRALRVEADVRLATGEMSLDDAVDFFVRHVPMDRQTAFEESCFYAGNPGLALSYQTGKLQLMSLVAAAVEADGEAFSLRRIHDAIWLDGNVPFSLLRWQLLGDRSVLDAIDADPATGAPAPPPAWQRAA